MSKINTKEKLVQTMLACIWVNNYGCTSVDEICKKAGVNKGSFYYHFPSKEDLALAAMDASWASYQVLLDQVFSIQNKPLERLEKYFQVAYQQQTELASIYGFVPGCPYTGIGSEQGTQHEKIRLKVTQKHEQIKKYFEATIKAGMEEGIFLVEDALEATDDLFAYHLGLFVRARIANDASVILGAFRSAKKLLMVAEKVA